MALSVIAREANLRDSIKKYFVDNLTTIEAIPVTFDKGLYYPSNVSPEPDKWVAVQFGNIEVSNMSAFRLDILCCTRKDSEGFKLAQLRDKVVGYLTDGTKPDGARRITIYRSYETSAWVQIGYFLVLLEVESQQLDAPDGAKFKIVPVTLKWGSRV